MRLAITNLEVSFGERRVVNLAELAVGEAEIVGLAGTAGAAVTGSVRLDGKELIGLSAARLRAIRGRRIAAIFQSPALAFNPVFRVGAIVSRALRQHGLSAAEARQRADAAMRSVLLPPDLLHRYPAQLSGGQLQRVAIALALALRAEVLLADEPTSALDVTVQAEVLDLLRGLRERDGMSVLLISHDLAVVAELCDRVAIMQRGEIVEQGPAGQVLSAPQHEYTAELLAAVPRLGPERATPILAAPPAAAPPPPVTAPPPPAAAPPPPAGPGDGGAAGEVGGAPADGEGSG